MFGDNGSGMHCHQSLAKTASTCSQATCTAVCPRWRCTTSAASSNTLKAINAFANPTTNSYKRLVPGYEAPVMLAYSARKPFCLHPYPGRAEPESSPHRSTLPGIRLPTRTWPSLPS